MSTVYVFCSHEAAGVILELVVVVKVVLWMRRRQGHTADNSF